jgi:hypothetical protein
MTSNTCVESGGVPASRALAGLAAAVLVLILAGGAQARPAAIDDYRGLGTWVDLYDPAQFADPEGTVAGMAARGVRTLYLETGNYKQRSDLYRPARLGRFIEAAHDAGIRVVAWYLPSFKNLARDLRRSLAAVEFRTPGGERFDSFALDIEASVVKSPMRRSQRLLELSRQLRAEVGGSYPLGAIIPSPRGMQLVPSYWPGFPYAELAGIYDVFLPMTYFSYRVEGGKAVEDYIVRSMAIIREETGNASVPIHVIGGIGDRTSRLEARGFMRAAMGCRAVGWSVYDYSVTRNPTWAALTSPPAVAPNPSC